MTELIACACGCGQLLTAADARGTPRRFVVGHAMRGRPNPKPARPAADRFWEKVDQAGECWLWTGFVNPNGYGQFAESRRKPRYAHRTAWELTNGAIPKHLQIDHLCKNRRCVRPAHMELVSSAENTRRAPASMSSINRAKETCPKGHSYDGTRTRHGRVERVCTQCRRDHAAARKRRLSDGS